MQQPSLAPRQLLQLRRPGRRGAVLAALASGAATASKADGCPRGAQWVVHKFGGTCMSNAERIKSAAQLIIADPASAKVVVVSAMGSHPTSPVKVTDLILNMIAKAARQDMAFLVDLAALQEKHVATARLLLGQTPELTEFISRHMDDIGNLKAMLQAMSIGGCEGGGGLEVSALREAYTQGGGSRHCLDSLSTC